MGEVKIYRGKHWDANHVSRDVIVFPVRSNDYPYCTSDGDWVKASSLTDLTELELHDKGSGVWIEGKSPKEFIRFVTSLVNLEWGELRQEDRDFYGTLLAQLSEPQAGEGVEPTKGVGVFDSQPTKGVEEASARVSDMRWIDHGNAVVGENGGSSATREHELSADCWCNPEVERVSGDTRREEQVSLGALTEEDIESLWNIGGYVTKTIAKDGDSKEILLAHVGTPQEGKPRRYISFVPHFENEDSTDPIPDHYKNCKYGGVGRCRADCTHQYTNLPKKEVSSSSPAKVGIELTEEEARDVYTFLDRGSMPWEDMNLKDGERTRISRNSCKVHCDIREKLKLLTPPPVELPEPKEPEETERTAREIEQIENATKEAIASEFYRMEYLCRENQKHSNREGRIQDATNYARARKQWQTALEITNPKSLAGNQAALNPDPYLSPRVIGGEK